VTLYEGVPRFFWLNPGVSLNIHGREEDGRLYPGCEGCRTSP